MTRATSQLDTFQRLQRLGMHPWESTWVPHRNKQGTCILTQQPESHQGFPCCHHVKGTISKRSMTRTILRILRMVACQVDDSLTGSGTPVAVGGVVW